MAKMKGLGRGLDALLSKVDESQGRESLQTLALDRMGPGKYQPRTHMDDGSLERLADSIRAQGVMQPILVRPVDGGRFEIIAGERRWRAAQKAGLREVPALVRNVPDQAALAMALIENIQREDLNPLEEAQGIQRLIDEFGLTHETAAQAVGRSRSAVTNLLRLLQLAAPVQEHLRIGKLDMGHARALLPLPGGQQIAIANRVIAESLSVREAERLVQKAIAAPDRGVNRGRKSGATGANADIARLESDVSDSLGAQVRIEPSAKGAGRIVINYSSLEQLDGILTKLR